MSLELLINIICDLAIKRNLVNYAAAGPSIYRLNDETIKDYPFIFASPTNNVVTRKNFTDYTLTLFYVDRLLLDSTNETHIFSIANDTLVNLLRQLKQLEGIVDVSEPTVRLFTETERMADRCAGGYTDVTITVLNDAECPVIMDETGEMLGTYIPNTLKDLNVLDSLASKEWVKLLIASSSISGITPEDFETILKKYVPEKKFATINGRKITNNQKFNLVEQDDYTKQIKQILQAISAATPEDYETLSGTVVGNVAKIADISAFTSGLSFTINEHTENIEQVSALTQTLSGETSDLRVSLGDLSASTSSAVSSITEGLETLSEAISGYTPQGYEALQQQVSANTENIAGLSVLVEQLEAEGNLVFIIDDKSTQADINALVDAALNIGQNDWAKITLLYKTSTYNGEQYVVLRPYFNYHPSYDAEVYFSGILANHPNNLSLFAVGFSKNTMEQIVDRQDYQIDHFVPIEDFRTINGQTLVGSGYGDITVGNVSSTSISTLVSISQEDYDLLDTKDNNTLYIIK